MIDGTVSKATINAAMPNHDATVSDIIYCLLFLSNSVVMNPNATMMLVANANATPIIVMNARINAAMMAPTIVSNSETILSAIGFP